MLFCSFDGMKRNSKTEEKKQITNINNIQFKSNDKIITKKRLKPTES